MSESTSPVLIRSVSSDGTCRCNFSANRAEICCASVFESGMWHVPVFGREQVEEEAIERTAVDIVTLPLPADVSEVELLEAALRRDVCLGLAQPTGDELASFGGVQRQQFHDARMPPALSDAWPVPRGAPDGPSPTCRRSGPDHGRPVASAPRL